MDSETEFRVKDKLSLTRKNSMRHIQTTLDWDDLELDAESRKHIDEVRNRIERDDTLIKDRGLAEKLKSGYSCLFYGPPGTGKTLAACLLGKSVGRKVYLMDLSMAISKYIGETEKNITRVFDQARRNNWILFFDEADSLFGRRSKVQSSNDKYANQEISYLLQRVETHDGICIVSTTNRKNIDKLFLRQFQSMVNFQSNSQPHSKK